MVRRNATEHLNEMSASVFNPFPLFEMRGTMRGAGVEGMDEERNSRVRVNLFGPVDHEEVKKALEAELAEQTERDSVKYNFDFKSGRPRGKDGGRYAWKEVVAAVPAPYELRGMPYNHSHTAEEGPGATAEGSSSAASGPSTARTGVASRPAAARGPTAPGPVAPATKPVALKQSRLTEYHQKRKRLLPQEKPSSQSTPAPSDAKRTVFKKTRVQKT